MIFTSDSSPLKRILTADTVRELPRPSGRKLTPPPTLAPSAKPARKPVNKNQSLNPLVILFNVGD